MLERITELFGIIENAKKEVEGIQEKCSHNSRNECDYMWAPGHFSHGIICTDCHKFLGEGKKYLDWIPLISLEGLERTISSQRERLKFINPFGDLLITEMEFRDHIKKYL